jgi:hypothetical protein
MQSSCARNAFIYQHAAQVTCLVKHTGSAAQVEIVQTASEPHLHALTLSFLDAFNPVAEQLHGIL